MSDIDILDEFAPSDSESEWSEEDEPIQDEVREEIKEEETPEEDTLEIQMEEENSEDDESSELEEEKKEDKEKIVEEEFGLPEIKEEEIENVDIDLSEINGNDLISFSIMFLSKCFMIKCSSEIPLDLVMNKISENVNINKKYLCLRSMDRYEQQLYGKSLKELGIENNFILSISLSLPLLVEGEEKEIEIMECKDMNDFYVSLLHELNYSSCQLFINSKEVETLQFPPLPLSSYFSNDVVVEVKKDLIINVIYHNLTMPLFIREFNAYRKVKTDLVCYNIYKIIQDVLDIQYPLVILFGKQVIYPNKLVAESSLSVIHTLNVYDLFIQIPKQIQVLDYTAEIIEGYGKEDLLTVDLDIEDCPTDVIKEFILQFSDIVNSEDGESTKAVISSDSCILQSTYIARKFYGYYQDNMRIPACIVNNNYQYKHPEVAPAPEIKPVDTHKQSTQNYHNKNQKYEERSSMSFTRRNTSREQRNDYSYQNNNSYSPKQDNVVIGTPRRNTRNTDYSGRDYQEDTHRRRTKGDDYQGRDYQRDNNQRRDYQRNDYQRNDYQRNNYQRDNNQRNDYQRDNNQRRDYQRADNQRDSYQRRDNQRDNNQRDNYQRRDHQRNDKQQQDNGRVRQPDGQRQRNNRESQQSNQRPNHTFRRRSD